MLVIVHKDEENADKKRRCERITQAKQISHLLCKSKVETASPTLSISQYNC